MKILLDGNFGKKGKDIVKNAGFEAATVEEMHPAAASDDELIERCRLEKRVLVTLEKEFSNPFVYKPSNYCGIAVIRLKRAPAPEDLHACLRLFVNGLARHAIDGKLWIIQKTAIRVYHPDDEPDGFEGENVREIMHNYS